MVTPGPRDTTGLLWTGWRPEEHEGGESAEGGSQSVGVPRCCSGRGRAIRKLRPGPLVGGSSPRCSHG